MSVTKQILIIGAGLSGLMAATVLRQKAYQRQAVDRQITIIDKGRSVGGRLATRRIGDGTEIGRADHGAQFFTVRTREFHHYVTYWRKIGLVYEWSQGWANQLGDGSAGEVVLDGYPRYAIKDGMNELARHLAVELQEHNVAIHTGTQIQSIHVTEANQWVATATNGSTYEAEMLIMTPPVPQTLTLLAEGNVMLASDDHQALARIQYAPCLCGLFHVDGEVNLPEPGALQTPGQTITWIADNQRKGISPNIRTITVHAGADYSRRYYDADDAVALAGLQDALTPLLSPDTTLVESQLKRWRYSQPEVSHPKRYLQAQRLPPLFIGGDAFGGPRVEGAALSGMAIGQTIRKVLS
ncbi:MAG: FAD-dependent oxidoreductase [Chloroflexota bacterium]